MTSNKTLSINETANILGVSSATVRNWMKQDYLNPLQGSKYFRRTDVMSLKAGISSGKIERLSNRANKSSSLKSFVPVEYAGSPEAVSFASEIIKIYSEGNYSKIGIIFHLALVLIKNRLPISSIKFSSEDKMVIKDRPHLSDELNKIYGTASPFDCDLMNLVTELEIPGHNDLLGLVYQSLITEGEKSSRGSYYTPESVARQIATDYISPSMKVLDPCCGTGGFLLEFAEHIDDPDMIFGMDIDPAAVWITKINLLLKFFEKDFRPNIFNLDFILCSEESFESNRIRGFDLVASNPPWGGHFPDSSLDLLLCRYPDIKSFETFSYFIKRGLDLLSRNGVLSYVLPESILGVSRHSDIRKYIVENFSITRVENLDRIFKNVFSNAVRVDIAGNCKDSVKIINGSEHTIESSMIKAPDYSISINTSERDMGIIADIYSREHQTLKDNAEWTLGIVTGNNSRFISPVKKNDEYLPIYKGKDIEKFFFSEPASYIRLLPEKFQQMAPIEKYEYKEKLIYRFISDRLVFAYDDKQRLSLNSANIVVPKIKGYSVKLAAAFLNSELYQYIFQKKFSTIKVLRRHLEALPFPELSKTEKSHMEKAVDKILEKKCELSLIDDYVYSVYGISRRDREYIRKSID